MKNIYSPSYYTMLGLQSNATDKEIKSAYRKLIMIHHEDKNPNDPKAKERSQDIISAYAVLSKKEERTKYDRDLKNYFDEIKGKKTESQYVYESEPDNTSWFAFAAAAVVFILLIGLLVSLTEDNSKNLNS